MTKLLIRLLVLILFCSCAYGQAPASWCPPGSAAVGNWCARHVQNYLASGENWLVWNHDGIVVADRYIDDAVRDMKAQEIIADFDKQFPHGSSAVPEHKWGDCPETITINGQVKHLQRSGDLYRIKK